VESQEELFTLLEKVFGNEQYINLKKFTNIVENVRSEIFLYILIFLMESRPFSKTTLDNYDSTQKKKDGVVSKSPTVPKSNRLIASPNLNSKFSPSVTISKSPSITKKTLGFDISNKADKNIDMLLKLSGKAQQSDPKNVLLKYTTPQKQTEDTDEGVSVNNVPVSRKNRNPNLKNIKNIEGEMNKQPKAYNDDMEILPATKYKVEAGKNKLGAEEIEKISKE
jgi:hypothetical protein